MSSTPSKTYRSEAAAQRAAAAVTARVPHAQTETQGRDLYVYVTHARLTPEQKTSLENMGVKPVASARPDPANPLLPKVTRKTVVRSKVDNPGEVARAILEKHHKDDNLDARVKIIDEIIFAGVNPNTAKVMYARFRQEKGLSGLRASRRARLRKQGIALAAKQPKPIGRKVQNGVTRPSPETIADEVWTMADAMTRKLKRPVKRGELQERMTHVNEHSLAIYHKKWRKYHGHRRPGQHHPKREFEI